MTIYSVFGASLAASALMGQLLLPASTNADVAPVARIASHVSAPDESAQTLFDRDGRRVGQSVMIMPSGNGDLVAMTEQGAKPVAMMRGADGMLRLVVQ